MNELYWLNEVCEDCGLTQGSHCGEGYYSKHYKMYIPKDYCPGHAGRMDWDNGPGTVFKPTGIYGQHIYGSPARKKG
jgi:hypothetical protein